MSTPEIIGELKNVKVLLDRAERAVILGTEPPIKFSIDHPYIQGTKLERDARAALDSRKLYTLDEVDAERMRRRISGEQLK
jgi:hypothetical protein